MSSFIPHVPDLRQCLRELLAQVPPGRVTTFGRLGTALGDSTAAKWIAWWLWNDPAAVDLPGHRVVLKDGSIGPNRQETIARSSALLGAEGVVVQEGRVDLSAVWETFETTHPLHDLMRLQHELGAKVQIVSGRPLPTRAAGVDLSYVDDWTCVAALAEVDVEPAELTWSVTVPEAVRFPYVTGYLSFREIPLHEQSLAKAVAAGHQPEVVLVDGSGILHKRRAGIASHLGVVSGLCTVGVTKTLLCGDVDCCGMAAGEARPILVAGEIHGWAIQPRATGKPIFVSPGHLCDARFARDLVLKLLRGRKLPEPIWWADHLSRAEARRERSDFGDRRT